MNLFMPAERVLYDRAYYLSDEAEKDYAFEVAEEHDRPHAGGNGPPWPHRPG